MPVNPEKCFKQMLLNASMTEDAGALIPNDWRDQLREITAGSLIGEEREFYLDMFNIRSGKGSTYSLKKQLEESLKLIYLALINPTYPDDQKNTIVFKFHEGVPNCTPGFHDRMNELVIGLSPATDLDALLSKLRQEIVNRAATQTTGEVHAFNRFFVVAQADGYGVRPFNPDDRYRGNLPDAAIRAKLEEAFKQHYTFFSILHYLQDQLSVMLQRVGYFGRRSGDEIKEGIDKGKFNDYSLGDFNNIMTALSPFLAVGDLDLALGPETAIFHEDIGSVIDINWRGIISNKLKKDDYFIFTPADEALLTLLNDDSVSPAEFKSKLTALSDIPLLSNSGDVTICFQYFKSLPNEKKWFLIEKFVEKTPTIEKRNQLDIILKANPDIAAWLDQLPEFQAYYVFELPLSHNETRLYFAAERGYTRIVRDLLSSGDHDINAAKENGITPLYIAAQEGHPDVVNALLEKNGIDINVARAKGTTPLHIAAHNGHLKVVNALLAREGIDINAATKSGSTPLHFAAQNDHHDVVKALLARDGIDINAAMRDGTTPLYIAAQKGHLDMVKALLARDGIDINAATKSGSTPLYIAARKGHLEVVKALLARDDIKINAAKTDGATSLHVAAQNGHHEVVNDLLKKEGIKLNAAMRHGATPLYIAAENGHLEVVNALLEKDGIDINAAMRHGATPLYIAARKGHLHVVNVLLARDNININAAAIDGTTPLYAARHNGHADIVAAICKAKLRQYNNEVNKREDNHYKNALFGILKFGYPAKEKKAASKALLDALSNQLVLTDDEKYKLEETTLTAREKGALKQGELGEIYRELQAATHRLR